MAGLVPATPIEREPCPTGNVRRIEVAGTSPAMTAGSIARVERARYRHRMSLDDASGSVRLRTSTEADVPAIAAIYRHAVLTGRGSFELEGPSDDEMAARRAALVEGGFPYIVAEIDGTVAGYAYAGAYRPRPAYRGTLEDSVYVAEAYWRRGLARRLLARLIEDSEAAGYRQMIAVIGDSANLGSIRLHEQMGFTHAGVLRSVGWKHGLWLDTVIMQRPLGTGDATPGPAPAAPAA